MYETYIEALLAATFGLGGGLGRILVEMYLTKYNKNKIYWRYWIFRLIISGIIGMIIGVAFSYDYKVSILSGFLGLDVLQGMYDSSKIEKLIPSG